MVTEIYTEDGLTKVPTATEFIPIDDVPGPNRTGKPMVRGLNLAAEGNGVEIAFHEPYDDDVPDHIYICDECGHAEDRESAIADHLRTQHRDDMTL